MTTPRLSQNQFFVLAYSGRTIEDFRRLPDEAKRDAAGVITKLAHGRIQGMPLPALLDDELAGTHRVGLKDGCALLYRFHPVPEGFDQFATAHLVAAGPDDRHLRQRAIQRLQPAPGHVWNLAYTRDFLIKDLPALRQHDQLYQGLRETMATVAGPHPPRSHDPLASDQDVYVTALSATGQSVRQVPFDTAEQHASGADPYGLLTYRMLRPPAGVRSNTLLMVQAAPAAAADLHTDMQERLRLTQHRDARLLAGNQQIRERLLQQQRREQAGRSRSTTGSAPSPTPPAADAPRAQPAPQPADKARHRPDAAEPGHHQRRQ